MKLEKKEKLAKIVSVLIPICAFTVFLPLSEHKIEAQTNTQRAMVLGASTTNEETSQSTPETDFNLPKTVEATQSSFDPLAIAAKSLLAYDLDSGRILIDRDSDKKLAIASLTKLMTSVVASEDLAFSDPITITSADHVNVAPVLNIKNGEQVAPIDLVKAMLVGSANDAALTIANHFPDKASFVEKMNAKAAELGMTSTHFDNPVGFDSDQNYSTAADLQKLVAYALQKLPYAEIWQNTNYSFPAASGHAYSIKNSNDLVGKYAYIHSIKTGYTYAAKENMIVEAESSDGHKIVVMVLGTDDRNTNTKKVVDYIFKNFSWN